MARHWRTNGAGTWSPQWQMEWICDALDGTSGCAAASAPSCPLLRVPSRRLKRPRLCFSVSLHSYSHVGTKHESVHWAPYSYLALPADAARLHPVPPHPRSRMNHASPASITSPRPPPWPQPPVSPITRRAAFDVALRACSQIGPYEYRPSRRGDCEIRPIYRRAYVQKRVDEKERDRRKR